MAAAEPAARCATASASDCPLAVRRVAYGETAEEAIEKLRRGVEALEGDVERLAGELGRLAAGGDVAEAAALSVKKAAQALRELASVLGAGPARHLAQRGPGR